MANVRLLRQLAQSYDDRVKAVNAQYQDDRTIYEKAVAAHNASLSEAAAGTPYLGEVSGSPGAYGVFSGDDGSGNPVYAGQATVVDSPPAFSSAEPSGPVYVRNPDGTATIHTPELTSTFVGGDNYSQGYSWVPGATYKFLSSKGPVAPTIGDPGTSGFTEKEKGLLQQPTLSPSEMNMAAAIGVGGESTLAGEQPLSENSAFTNPEDPNNLKDRGVLARVLGGQL